MLLWAASDDGRLSPAARRVLEDHRTHLVLSVASIWELTLKVARGRLRLPDPPGVYFEDLARDFDLDVLPVHKHHVAALAELPELTTDPFDRMLVAQSLAEDLPLITADAQLASYPIEVFW